MPAQASKLSAATSVQAAAALVPQTFLHCDPLTVDEYPAGHRSQRVAELKSLSSVPRRQGAHRTAPAGANVPRPQTPPPQIVMPTAPLYVPAGHSLHRVYIADPEAVQR